MPPFSRILIVLLAIGSPLPLLGGSLTLGPALPGERILVVAPHIDDEALAAGGYAHDALRAGAEVFVVYLTAGDHSRTAMTANRLTFFATARFNRKGQRRLAEGERAMQRAGVDETHLFTLGYPDRGLRRMILKPEGTIRSASTGKRSVSYASAVSPGAPHRLENLVDDLWFVLETVQPDIVIAPLADDAHPDHRATAELISSLLDRIDRDVTSLGYRIHSRSILDPLGRKRARAERRVHRDREWLIYPLSLETAEEKRLMLSEYRSQRRSPYLRAIFGASTRRPESFVRVRG